MGYHSDRVAKLESSSTASTAGPVRQVKFQSMEHFWEYVKAQGAQTGMAWFRLTDEQREQIRAISPHFVANIEALAAAIDGEVGQ